MKNTLKNIIAASIAAVALNANAGVLTFDTASTPGVSLGGDMTWNGNGGGHLYMERWNTTDTINFSSNTFVNDFQMNYQPWKGYGRTPVAGDWLVNIAAYASDSSLLWSSFVDLTSTANDWNKWITVTVNTANVARLSFAPTGQAGVRNGYWPSIDNLRINELAAPVPEPETYAMLLAGLGLMGCIARRRKQKLANV
jgi:hypothetical protein